MKPEQIFSLLQANPTWVISGSTLKADMKSLGFKWMEGLKESLVALGKKIGAEDTTAKKG